MSLYALSQVLTEKSLRILKYLSTNREVEQFQIQNIFDCSYRQSLRDIKPLRGYHLISLARTELSKKGMPKKFWRISLLGLEVILSLKNELWNQYDRIAETHKEKLPLIFGNQNLFKTISLYSSDELTRVQALESTTLQDEVKRRFTSFISNRLQYNFTYKQLNYVWNSKKQFSEHTDMFPEINTMEESKLVEHYEKELEHEIYGEVFFGWSSLGSSQFPSKLLTEYTNSLLIAARRNEQLNNYIIELVTSRLRQNEQRLGFIQNIIDVLEQTDESIF